MIFVVLLCLVVAHSEQIAVDCDKGNNTLCEQSNYPCKTLHAALEVVRADNALIRIENGHCPLTDRNATLTYSNITISGNGPDVTLIECDNGTGFAFIDVSNISISGLTLSGCGQLRNSTTVNSSSNSVMLFRAALYFENVTNVVIDNVEVSNSIGMGVAMYDVTGNVTVNNSIFRNNSVPSDERKMYPGGGGFSVEFTYCKPGAVTVDDSTMCNNGTNNKDASYLFIAWLHF